jgi:DNA-binding transcriptional regulator LsrR (DeoR family)
MSRIEEQRLMTKVARLYYERGLRQTEIVKRLDISQPTISRLLKRAHDEDIVRITISAPYGTHPELEDALETAYGLKEATVVDAASEVDEEINRSLGAASAFYLETTLKPKELIGISSWSATLLAMVNAMHTMPRVSGVRVLQILGGVGNPGAEVHATHLTRRLAALVGGEAVFLPAPGVTGSAKARRVLLDDRFTNESLQLFGKVTMALVGIGALEPSRLLAESGNVFDAAELRQLKAAGAVGDICLRFFDANGRQVKTALNDRVIGMELDQLKCAFRSVGIAGGKRKYRAIRGALTGGWINVLITDRATAARLIKEAPA